MIANSLMCAQLGSLLSLAVDAQVLLTLTRSSMVASTLLWSSTLPGMQYDFLNPFDQDHPVVAGPVVGTL